MKHCVYCGAGSNFMCIIWGKIGLVHTEQANNGVYGNNRA